MTNAPDSQPGPFSPAELAFHVTPFGPVGLMMFIAAILLIARDRAASSAALPLGRPEVA